MIENIDFYYTNEGMLVFTELYLLKQGKCCNNNCRHCPYKNSEDVRDDLNCSNTNISSIPSGTS